MKKFLLLVLLLSYQVFAQKVVISESEERIEGMNRKGLGTILELDEEEVRAAWIKKLKEFGSLRTKSGAILVDQADMAQVSGTPVKLMSKVETTSKGVKVWYAIDMGDAYVTSADASRYAAAEKILRDFAISMYIADINDQIKEAEKVLANTVREQERMLQKYEQIKNSIARNRIEKTKLEVKLAENENEYKILVADSVQNTKNQAAAVQNVEKMKKAVEIVRGKISKVE